MAKKDNLERYEIECSTCKVISEYEVGTPFPPVETLVCRNCDKNHAKEVLQRVMGKQYRDLQKLSRWILLVTIPSMIVLIIAVTALVSPSTIGMPQSFAVFLLVFSAILLTMGLSFSGTLRWRQNKLKDLADEKDLTLIIPD